MPGLAGRAGVGHGRGVTALVVWMLVVVAAAVGVLVAVALPKLREGRPLLTQDGRARVERARRAAAERARDARRRTSDLAGQAADRTRRRGPAAEPEPEPESRPERVRVQRAPAGRAVPAPEPVVDLRAVEPTVTTSPVPRGGPTRRLAWEQRQAPGPRHARH